MMKSLVYVFATILVLQTVSSTELSAPATCEDVLSADTCDKLRNIAKIFHEKASIVNDAVKAAVAKHINNAKDIIIFAKNYLVEKATSFKCEDALSAELCKNLVDLAGRFKVSVANLTKDIEEAIADGIVKGKALYQKTVEIMLNKINNLSCESLINAETCEKIMNFAKKLHASSHDIQRAIVDAYSKGLVKAVDFYNDVKEYLTSEISCERVLSVATCDAIQKMADKFGASFNKVTAVLREAVANGVTKISDLYKAAIKYIIEKWMGIVSYRAKRSVETDAKLKEIQKVSSQMESAISNNKKEIYGFVKYLRNLLLQALKGNSQGEAWKAALASIKDFIKNMIKSSVSDTKKQLPQVVDQIKDLFKNMVKPEQSAAFMQDIELMDAMTIHASNKIFAQMTDDAEKEMNNMFNDVSDDAQSAMNALVSDIRQKRDTNSWINDEFIAVIAKFVSQSVW